MDAELIAVYRWCWRCQRWRKLGNFSKGRKGTRYGSRKTCMRCFGGQPNANRTPWTITDSGRAYLRELREAAA